MLTRDGQHALHAAGGVTRDRAQERVLARLGNEAVSVALLPFASSFVFFPAILKSWLRVPRLTTLNVTEPLGTVFFESVNLNSLGLPAVTETVVADELANADTATTSDTTATSTMDFAVRLISGCPSPWTTAEDPSDWFAHYPSNRIGPRMEPRGWVGYLQRERLAA